MACRQRGISIVAILVFAIALVAVLTASLFNAGFANQQINTQLIAADLIAQGRFVSQTIERCASEYPQGASAAAPDPFPDAATSTAAAGLVCPGSGQTVWATGPSPPPSPAGFSGWTYYHPPNAAIVQIAIATTKAATLLASVQKAVAAIGSAASYTQTTTSGVTTLTLYITLRQ
ncbi:hypothetical protein E4K72_03560 [Oxalobacteraceae bacterium OM1]|nr:hypothetical protein E4K72_03560 [Oxalobacteraceae bacterium OM1]